MLVDLVHVRTSDGVRLDGALRMPEKSATESKSNPPIDAVVCVHGTGANFYSRGVWDPLAERLLARGIPVLTVNTRGHDGISTAYSIDGARRVGAAYEIIDDARYDLPAWCGYLQERGHRRVALLGHSLGALKSIYALTHVDALKVTCVVAISAPHLSYERFIASRSAETFLRAFGQAEALIEAGAPDRLIEIEFPIPYAISARGFIDKYGPQARYDVLALLPKVRCPLLMMYGAAELSGNVPFEGLPDRLEALREEHALSLSVEVVAGADHFYSGCQPELAVRVERWLRGRLPAGRE
mgnify:CR=1 FL=1